MPFGTHLIQFIGEKAILSEREPNSPMQLNAIEAARLWPTHRTTTIVYTRAKDGTRGHIHDIILSIAVIAFVRTIVFRSYDQRNNGSGDKTQYQHTLKISSQSNTNLNTQKISNKKPSIDEEQIEQKQPSVVHTSLFVQVFASIT